MHHMETLSPKLSLIIGLSIPVVLVLLIAAAVLLPGRNIEPTTDFLYAVGQYSSYISYSGETAIQHSFSVRDDKLIESTDSYPTAGQRAYPPYPSEKDMVPRFFIHHAASDTNTEISVDEAKKLTLSTETASPEGLTVTFGSRSYGVFPFYSGSDDNRQKAYVSNGKASKQISLISDVSINYAPFQMVGWVIK